jgi:tripartite-type tricarboxylate transporter receptor subunit TctC
MKNCLRALAAVLASVTALAAGPVRAQAYPSKPITLVVPFSAGGAVDTMARLLATKMTTSMGTSVVVKNFGGASGAIGMGEVARAAPDGYTVLYTPNSIAILPALYRKLPFDPEKDLQPVSQFISSSLIMTANPKMSIGSVNDLVGKAKAQPGKLNFGSSGVADPLQLGMELLKISTGTNMIPVPYKGQGPMLQALLSGEVDVGIISLQTGLPYLRAGKLRPIAVTGSKRSAALPAVPTVAESVPGYEMTSWHGVFAPASTPREVVERLQRAVAQAAQDPEVKQVVEAAGNETVGSTPAAFHEKFAGDLAKFRGIVREAKIPFQD